MKKEFINHTISWYKGEIFEMGMLIIIGISLLALSFYFWKFSHYEVSRVLIIPILVVGLFWGIAGSYGLFLNNNRVKEVIIQYEENPNTFMKNEKKRVDVFIGYYRYLLLTWSILILIGLCVFIFWGGNQARAIGIAIILFSVVGLMVDHTSEQNAKTYYKQIQKSILS